MKAIENSKTFRVYQELKDNGFNPTLTIDFDYSYDETYSALAVVLKDNDLSRLLEISEVVRSKTFTAELKTLCTAINEQEMKKEAILVIKARHRIAEFVKDESEIDRKEIEEGQTIFSNKECAEFVDMHTKC